MGRPQGERGACWRNLIITNKLTIYCVLHIVLSASHLVSHLTINPTRKVPLLPKWVQIQRFSPGQLTFKLNWDQHQGHSAVLSLTILCRSLNSKLRNLWALLDQVTRATDNYFDGWHDQLSYHFRTSALLGFMPYL